MMKIGFSSLACPTWDLETIVTGASSMGFDGVELRGLGGELHLPLVPQLSADPAGVRSLFRENNVELVCLGTSVTLDARDRREVGRQKATLTEFVELASALGCPNVRAFMGEVQKNDNQRAALARIAESLRSLPALLSRTGVTLLIENGGDFPISDALWFVIDAVDHPRVRCCWNQCHAMTVGERATKSLPRLGHKIGMVHICDAIFDPQGILTDYALPGEGDTEIARQIELLKGMIYDRYLMLEWPKLWVASLASADVALPAAAKFLRERIDEKQAVLTAYKNDKNAPRLTAHAAGTAS